MRALAGEAGLVQMVAALCGDWPEGAAGEGAGVVRLLGEGQGRRRWRESRRARMVPRGRPDGVPDAL